MSDGVSTTSAGVGRSATRIMFPIVRRAARRSRRTRSARRRRVGSRSLADRSPSRPRPTPRCRSRSSPESMHVPRPFAGLVEHACAACRNRSRSTSVAVRKTPREGVDESAAGTGSSRHRSSRCVYTSARSRGVDGAERLALEHVGVREVGVHACGRRGRARPSCAFTASAPPTSSSNTCVAEVVGDDDHEPREVVERGSQAGRQEPQHAAAEGAIFAGVASRAGSGRVARRRRAARSAPG